jgi:hypothetical protein
MGKMGNLIARDISSRANNSWSADAVERFQLERFGRVALYAGHVAEKPGTGSRDGLSRLPAKLNLVDPL